MKREKEWDVEGCGRRVLTFIIVDAFRLDQMKGYCLRTHLLEDPHLYLYYKGIEGDRETCVLNTIVGFTPDDAFMMDEESANRICSQQNQNRVTLCENGFSEFEVKIIK